MRVRQKKIKVGITIGDPSGIGPLITLKALRKVKGLADFIVIGDSWVLNRISSLKEFTPRVKFIDLENVSKKNFSFGKVSADYGQASLGYLDKALRLIKDNQIDCLVTCPLSKEAVNKAGVKFFGHTEYLAERLKVNDFAMMLLNDYLKIVLVTRHRPLRSVAAEITSDKIARNISLIQTSLKRLFAIKRPRLVVCGLNPHASDNGVIGDEENRVIKPALRKFKDVTGPLSADIAIYKTYKKEYDCALAMYHDQALIALKLTDSLNAANLTLGLPFIRTSPLHGTAFDIAKSPNLANPSSLIAAIKLGIRCTLNLKKD